MTDHIDNSEGLFLSPPLRVSSQDKKHWLAGIWLLPGVESEQLREHFNILQYHWDDRNKLQSDVEKIKIDIQKLKKVLYPALNSIHECNHSARYWDLLVGEWIYLYTQIVFDRWSVMESAFKTLKLPKLIQISFQESKIPFDTNDFQRAALSSHDWNANLLSDIYSDFLGHFKKKIDRDISIEFPSGFARERASIIRKLIAIVSRVYISVSRNGRGIVVQTPYLGRINYLKLCVKMRALMYFEPKEKYVPLQVKCNVEMRQELSEFLRSQDYENQFLNFLMMNVELYLPAIYLEEFARHESYSKEIYFNYFPRTIVTANSHYSNESWKIWAACSVEKGARIVLLQHGGHYGHSKFSLIQDYEIELADKFLSWGWTCEHNKKVVAAPANKLIGLRIKRKTKLTCLVVTFETSTYAYWLASFPIGPQVFSSKEMTLGFLTTIENPVRDSIRVRVYPVDYGLEQRTEIQVKFPELALSPDNRDFKTDLRDARIVVFNYFSTSFIEAVKMGVPSVAFMDPTHWEVNDSFKDLFTSLVNIGILHHSSDSCAQFVMQNWDAVETWWTDSATIGVVEEFLEFFGYTGSKPIGELSRAILDI